MVVTDFCTSLVHSVWVVSEGSPEFAKSRPSCELLLLLPHTNIGSEVLLWSNNLALRNTPCRVSLVSSTETTSRLFLSHLSHSWETMDHAFLATSSAFSVPLSKLLAYTTFLAAAQGVSHISTMHSLLFTALTPEQQLRISTNWNPLKGIITLPTDWISFGLQSDF